MKKINYDILKSLLFESFSIDTFLQWFYENQKLIELDHKEFIDTAFADWDGLMLSKPSDIKALIKNHLIGERLFKYWEIEFYLIKILEPENSITYGCRLYSEYYEDKNNFFLNSICDLIVLYCYEKINLNLPSLNSYSRKKVNSNILYPRIISECKPILNKLKKYQENSEESFSSHSSSLNNMQSDFANVLNWYKIELKKVDDSMSVG